MKRDIEQWRAEGRQILNDHKVYDLTSREIQQLITYNGVHSEIDFYNGVNAGLDLGITIGWRIAMSEMRKGENKS